MNDPTVIDNNHNDGIVNDDNTVTPPPTSSSLFQSSRPFPVNNKDRLTSLKSMLPPLSPHLSTSSAPITIASSSTSPAAPRIGSALSSDNLAPLRFSSSVHNLSVTGASPRAGGLALLPMPSSSPCCSSSHHLHIEIDSPSPHPAASSSSIHSLSYTPSPLASTLTLHTPTPCGDNNHGLSSYSHTPASSRSSGSGIPRCPRVERYQSYQQYHHHLHGAYSWNDTTPSSSHSHHPSSHPLPSQQPTQSSHPVVASSSTPQSHEEVKAAEGASTIISDSTHNNGEERGGQTS